jgi:hypothetical protein
MLKRGLLSLTLAVLASALLHASPAVALGLDGTWTTADAQGTLARLVIASDVAGRATLQGFGRCSPSECNWGSVPLTTYGKNISDATSIAGVAAFNTRLNSTTVTVQLSDPGVLQVDVFTHFSDGSGRKNYFAHQVLRQPLQAGVVSPYERATSTRYGSSVFTRPSPPPALPGTTPSPSAPSTAGQRTILPDGSVEITYADGTKKIFGKGGVTTITPDGKQSYHPVGFMEIAAQPPTPPSTPDSETSKWAELEASELLRLIKTLVSNDQASIDNLLAKETQMAWYQKIDNRTRFVQALAAP